jgi:hypothetical protein
MMTSSGIPSPIPIFASDDSPVLTADVDADAVAASEARVSPVLEETIVEEYEGVTSLVLTVVETVRIGSPNALRTSVSVFCHRILIAYPQPYSSWVATATVTKGPDDGFCQSPLYVASDKTVDEQT